MVVAGAMMRVERTWVLLASVGSFVALAAEAVLTTVPAIPVVIVAAIHCAAPLASEAVVHEMSVALTRRHGAPKPITDVMTEAAARFVI